MSLVNARSLVLAFIVVWTLAAAQAFAAGTTAVVVGYVRTVAGAPVEGADITAVSPSARYTARSDSQGRFTLAAVAADTYVISAEKAGSAPQLQHGVTVYPGSTLRLTLTLEPRLREIGRVSANAERAFTVGAPQDAYTVTGAEARGQPVASASGLATYARNTVQGAVARVPGVQQDPFANVVIRASASSVRLFARFSAAVVRR